jgi:uncharacterized protein
MIKKVLGFFSIFLFVALSFGQEDSIMRYVKFYYPGGQLSSEGYLREEKPDGYWKTYFENGLLKSEGNRENYLLDGSWKFYNEEGVLTVEINYKEDKKNGKRISYLREEIIEENFESDVKQGFTYFYYPDGKRKKEIFFKDGLEEGLVKEYDTTGLIITLFVYKKGFIVSREIINRHNSLGNKHGQWMEFYTNGKIKQTSEWRNGVLNGFVKDYDESGNLLIVQKYINGVVQPEAAEIKVYEIKYDYYESGKVKIVGSYREDQPDGIRREYDESGKIIKGFIFRSGILIAEGIIDEKGLKQGEFIEYFENGSMMALGKYINSKPVGPWKYYYPDGSIEQEGGYDNKGNNIGEWIWYYANGAILKKENYENGLQEGDYEEYDINGKIIVKGQYFDGAETGNWFWEIGDTREEGQFVDGQESGNWVVTDINTQKKIFEGKYIDGEPNGKHVYYWETGQKRLEGHYIMGKKEGEWFYYDTDGIVIVKITYKNGIEKKYDRVVIQPVIEE